MRDDIGLMEGYHSPQVEVAVRLNTNESPFPPPQDWVEAVLAEAGGVEFNRYPDRSAARLRKALAEYHGVQPSEIFCANGSNEVLQSLLLAYGGPGRSAAVFEPTYALHSHIARVTGTAVVVGARNADFTLDPAEVARVQQSEKPTVTFLCSPNNPTGRAEPEEAVAAVLESAPGLVVVDEAYGQFARWSAVDLHGSSERLVAVRTFSKTWSMAAMRLGYAVAPASVVEALEKVALPYHLDSVKQVAGRLALRYAGDMEARVATICEERGRLTAGLGDLAVEVWPSDANFILFRPRERDGRVVWEELLERSVLVRDCSSWPGLEGCLRVTVGAPEENSAFLAALGECLS